MDSQGVLVLNGPNLNLLGTREPTVYGSVSYDQLCARLRELGAQLNVQVTCQQSNHEGALIDALHEARSWASGVLINPGAYGHTSVALRDALLAISIPTVEVHLTNIAAREPFRHHSYLSAVCVGIINGFGVYGYELALMALARHISNAERRS